MVSLTLKPAAINASLRASGPIQSGLAFTPAKSSEPDFCNFVISVCKPLVYVEKLFTILSSFAVFSSFPVIDSAFKSILKRSSIDWAAPAVPAAPTASGPLATPPKPPKSNFAPSASLFTTAVFWSAL